jgi:PIN domain nuclease of toxin-antitoxin system
MSQPTHVIDASVLLTILRNEPGIQQAVSVVSAGAWITTINWAEVLSKLAEHGVAPEAVRARLVSQHVLGTTLLLYDFDDRLALEVGRLRPLTKSFGLSISDRACIALGTQLELPVVTADRAWSALQLGITVQVIR